VGDVKGVHDARLGDAGELAGDLEHLFFGLVIAPAKPCTDRVGTAAHRAGAVTKARAGGEPQ
jgi:hypothetical protein